MPSFSSTAVYIPSISSQDLAVALQIQATKSLFVPVVSCVAANLGWLYTIDLLDSIQNIASLTGSLPS
jgi:hypothetical protein